MGLSTPVRRALRTAGPDTDNSCRRRHQRSTLREPAADHRLRAGRSGLRDRPRRRPRRRTSFDPAALHRRRPSHRRGADRAGHPERPASAVRRDGAARQPRGDPRLGACRGTPGFRPRPDPRPSPPGLFSSPAEEPPHRVIRCFVTASRGRSGDRVRPITRPLSLSGDLRFQLSTAFRGLALRRCPVSRCACSPAAPSARSARTAGVADRPASGGRTRWGDERHQRATCRVGNGWLRWGVSVRLDTRTRLARAALVRRLSSHPGTRRKTSNRRRELLPPYRSMRR
jgi:hypothetical protein